MRAVCRTARPRAVARSGTSPCLFAENTVFAAPNDFDGILAIESHSGTTLWRRALPGGIDHLLGAKNGVLIASGEGLWGLALATGHVLWHVGFKDPASFGYGRGILAGDVVYWPTREEILVVEQATGTLRRRIPLLARDGEGGGNLLLAGDFLVVVQPQRITVFGPDAGSPPRAKDFSVQLLRGQGERMKAESIRRRKATYYFSSFVLPPSSFNKCPCGRSSK